MNTCFRVAALSAVILSLGCSKKSPDTTTTPAQAGTPTASARRNANVISGEELSKSGAQDVYRAIQMLRPGWFRSRARTSLGQGSSAEGLSVYFENTRYGPVESLQQLPVNGISEVRFLDPSEATNRYGTGHSMGAIVIKHAR